MNNHSLMVALFVLSLAHKRQFTIGKTMNDHILFEKELHAKIPWLLLPDAISKLTNTIACTHFETFANGYATSWMKYPSPQVLQELTNSNFSEKVLYQTVDTHEGLISEAIDILAFDRYNFDHMYYDVLRCHLLQDIAFSEILHEMLHCSQTSHKNIFIIRHTNKLIEESELKKQILLFEHFGFLKLAGIVLKKTGLLLDRAWFDEHVLDVLMQAYPSVLAVTTYSSMRIKSDLNERLQKYQFSLTDSEKASVTITNDIDGMLNAFYAKAFHDMMLEL